MDKETNHIIELGNDTFQFNPVNNPDHLKVLGLVTLDKDRLKDPEWVNYIQDCVKVASQEWDINTGTTLALRQKREARQKLEGAIQIKHPDHPLFKVYRANNHEKSEVSPLTMLANIYSLEVITGDGLAAIRPGSPLIRTSPRTLIKHFNFLQRAAKVLQWQGDVREIVRQYPDVLVKSMGSIAILSRLAARYGSDNHKTMSPDIIATALKRRLEAPLIALFENDDYSLGDALSWTKIKQLGTSGLRRQVYEAIGTGLAADKAGQQAIKRYIRLHPPPKDMLLRYPRLYEYIPQKPTKDSNEWLRFQGISGKEPWLKYLYPPKEQLERRAWIDNFNNLAFVGSQDIGQHKEEGKKYQEIMNARTDVVELFGWGKNAKISERFSRYLNQKHISYPKPSAIITACNLLSSYGIHTGPKLISQCFNVLNKSPSHMQHNMEQIIANGYDLYTAVTTRPSLLTADSKSLTIAFEIQGKGLVKIQEPS